MEALRGSIVNCLVPLLHKQIAVPRIAASLLFSDPTAVPGYEVRKLIVECLAIALVLVIGLSWVYLYNSILLRGPDHGHGMVLTMVQQLHSRPKIARTLTSSTGRY